MASINKTKRGPSLKTHEGAPAKRIAKIDQLKRSMMSCLLWENEVYEDGVTISDRIAQLVADIENKDAIADLAFYARTKGKLRHVPLFIARELVRNKYNVKSLLSNIIQRPDEISEFMSLYWKDGKTPIANSVKKGLALAFKKFNEYQLSKWDKNGKAISLRDVMFMVHTKPETEEQTKLFHKLSENELKTPDTWETNLSKGSDKKETFERLMAENKLGALACLRNLRGMTEVGVSKETLSSYITAMNVDRVLPFRFIAAARYAPHLETSLEKAMFKSISSHKKLNGKIAVVVDVSGSMDDSLSFKSDMTRLDAACGLAMLIRELSDNVDIFSFSKSVKTIPDRHGFALRDAIVKSQYHCSTYLGNALNTIQKTDYDTIIVITDEQSHDQVPSPKGKGYMINVASARNGVGYGKWLHIDGFSEAIIDFIEESIESEVWE